MFGLAGTGLLAVLLIGLHGLPAFGDFHGVYGLLVDRIEPKIRRATDIVTGLNFDLRASVAGVVLLLRHLRDEDDEVERRRGLQDHSFSGASDALRVTSLVLIPLLIALGAYVVLHGALTPGGGFQGGIVVAAGPLAALLAGRYFALKRLAPEAALELFESVGAAGYALIGLGGLIFAGIYLKNFLPLGTPAMLLSAGMMPLSSIAVGIEVTGAFLLVWTEFFDQSLVVSHDEVSSS
jgi:multicomponent Na+:H+ antiporter subunit B